MNSRPKWRNGEEDQVGGWDYPSEQLGLVLLNELRNAYPINQVPDSFVQRITAVVATLRDLREVIDQLDEDINADWLSKYGKED